MIAPRLAALLSLVTACATPQLHVAVTGPAAPALPAGRPVALDERDPLAPDLVERALLVADAYERYGEALAAMEAEARGRGCDTLARVQSIWAQRRVLIAAVCASRTASTTRTATTSVVTVDLTTTPAGARVYAWSSSPAVSRGDLLDDWPAAAPTRALCVAPCTAHLVPGSYILGYAPDDGAPRFGEQLGLAGPAAVDLRMKDNSSWRLAGVLVMVGAPLLAAGGVVVGTQTEDYGVRTGVFVGSSLLLVASGLVGLSLLKTSDEVVVTARDAPPDVR
jgi:hypothetical protein